MRISILALCAASVFAQNGALAPVPIQQPLSNSGLILIGACMYTYAAGTTTPLNTYSDPFLSTENANPMVLSGAGRLPAVYLSPLAYKFVFAQAVAGNCPGSPGSVIWSQDNVYDFGQTFSASLASSTGANLVGFGTTTVGAVLGSAFVYDITTSSAAEACASLVTVAVTSQTMWNALSSMTCSAPLWFPAGAFLQPANGQTITLAGPVTVSPGQKFCDVSLGGACRAGSVNVISFTTPENFGATCDGTTDDRLPAQAAIDFWGGTSSIVNGKVFLNCPLAVSPPGLKWSARSMEIYGCGNGNSGTAPKGCYISALNASGWSTANVVSETSGAGMWVHDLNIQSVSSTPPLALYALVTNSGIGNSANQFSTHERIFLGGYPVANGANVNPQAVNGIFYTGTDGNDDSMIWDDVIILHTTNGINMSQAQNVLQNFRNVGMDLVSGCGVRTASDGVFQNFSFDGDAGSTDFCMVLSADGAGVNQHIQIIGGSSAESARFLDLGSSASILPVIDAIGFKWTYGFGVTPVNDGSCGSGSGVYAACSKIIKGHNSPASLHFSNVCLGGTGTVSGIFPVLDFTNSGLSYPVDVDVNMGQCTAAAGQSFSANWLLGSSSNVLNNNQHFRMIVQSASSNNSTNGESWEYFCGQACGNTPYFVPTPGTFILPQNLTSAAGNGNSATDGCSGGVCPFSRAPFQIVFTGSDISGWTVAPQWNLADGALGGTGRFTVEICNYGGGGISVASPLVAGVQPIGGWSWGSIGAGTCSEQDYNSGGYGFGINHVYNAVSTLITGITP